MNRTVSVSLFLLLSVGAFAQTSSTGAVNEALLEAYQKEFVFLDSEIRLLKARQDEVKRDGDRRVAQAQDSLQGLEGQLLELTSRVAQKTEDLRTLDELGQKTQDSYDLVQSIVTQGRGRLAGAGLPAFGETEAGKKTGRTEAESLQAEMEHIFEGAVTVLTQVSSVQVSEREYFLPDGTKTSGPVVTLGRIAAFGAAEGHPGTLAPAGAGAFKLARVEGAVAAKELVQGGTPAVLPLYLFQGTEKEIDTNLEKTLEDILEAGGFVGYVILALGAIGLLLGAVRAFTLWQVGRRDASSVDKLFEVVRTGDWAAAEIRAQVVPGALGRVLESTIKGIRVSPDTVEDAIAAAVLAQQGPLERFRSLINVFAAVAPMLGLLGTVTGMIATFDIITLYGTGDPKLLSGGISEALVTTEFGLMVAIPLLLVGNLLNTWADGINTSLEVHALRVLNLKEEGAA